MEKLQSLVTRGRAGDVDAYGEIVRRFQDMGYGYAYSILGDFHLAEDAAQEAFIEAYRCLGNLREPAAFPGWFRRIIFKHCDRLTRRKEIPAASLEAAVEVASPARQPSQAAEDREMRDKVLAAIRSLPEQQREVTTLFYINGYSQNDIAEFLEVPAGTVKSRLTASRNRLKERMLNMVADELKSHPLPGEFPQQIQELLAKPRPLEIEGHPIREIGRAIQDALSEYELISGEEVVKKTSYGVGSGLADAYEVDEETILRTETSVTTFSAISGRVPPVRIMTAGRVFRDNPEDVSHLRAFHQFEALCIETGANHKAMRATVEKAIRAALPGANLKWKDADFAYPKVDCAQEAFIEHGEEWMEIAGCGMLTVETLTEAGYDPQTVSGFAFGLGLERIAMLKLGIDDIRKLWAPPYVPE